ncbi:hypothetical protein PCANC_00958 [Puccinia coronata f. sp. avenae]|uniref:Uncharacterized protein n=1 Tax=Puccinia coronata f. sp. avenae TaxID=200324 RepID=A0A2N5W6L3_9BASI|nr:hypothetical protein PCANC_00958 [Puccinia coronata f. sp. avenae]
MAEFLGEHAAQSTQLAANSQTANTTDERVAKLTSDMANIDARLSTLVDLLNTSPIFNPPPPPESQQQQGSNAHHMPPPPNPPGGSLGHSRPDKSYQPFMGLEFNQLKRIEPLKIPDLWFAGDAIQLTLFLRAIWDFLRPQGSLFQNEACRIVWVSWHFGYRPSENKCHLAPTESWYNSLVLNNVRQQGIFDQYADLDGVLFQLLQLQSVEALLSRLIGIFGNKFSKENTKRALATRGEFMALACQCHSMRFYWNPGPMILCVSSL